MEGQNQTRGKQSADISLSHGENPLQWQLKKFSIKEKVEHLIKCTDYLVKEAPVQDNSLFP